MTKEEADYDKSTLQKLAEQYLASSILSEEIFAFLQHHKNVPSEQIAQLLTSKAGKNQNSIYKNINEFTNYTASSLLRYWAAMVDICEQFKVPTDEIPSLDSLITKYKYLLDFINQISVEHKLERLVTAHTDTVWTLYKVYSQKDKKLTSKESTLLSQLSEHPSLQEKFTERKTAQIERMKET